jgi:hypothetical protein
MTKLPPKTFKMTNLPPELYIIPELPPELSKYLTYPLEISGLFRAFLVELACAKLTPIRQIDSVFSTVQFLWQIPYI